MGSSRLLGFGLAVAAVVGTSAPADASEPGKDLMQRPPWASCAYCHGDAGDVSTAAVPAIAGQPAGYLEKQLRDFRAGRRIDPELQMSSAVALLEEHELPIVAAYFAQLERRPPAVRAGEAAAAEPTEGAKLFWRGAVDVAPCAGCHAGLPQGATTSIGPYLTQLHAEYLQRQLRDFRSGRRANDAGGTMRALAQGLTDEQISAVSAYIAGCLVAEDDSDGARAVSCR